MKKPIKTQIIPVMLKTWIQIFVKAVPNNLITDLPVQEVTYWIESDKYVPVIEELNDEHITQSIVNPQEAQVQEEESDEKERAMADIVNSSWNQN